MASTSAPGAATVQLSDTKYAAQRKELLALMSQLRAVGAQAELDLPRIVVIGNQSAGKSSVVEAISGIKVPRDSGTCTRSPIECRMATGPKWSCQISIRREFDKGGKRRGDVSEERFGAPLTDDKKVELMLRRAQLLVLDETLTATEALRMDEKAVKQAMMEPGLVKFSKNVVCVDLEGPELTDLQFIDLPGLIQNASADVVRLVEDMVVETISGNCLILVAIPMTDDIENQIALRLARDRDPPGLRTIGVLTKPDVVSAGSNKRTDWLEIIEGRTRGKREQHTLHHGYYCTRQPDDDERARGGTTADARQNEATFFSQTTPWSTTIEPGRFGTENLVATLSTLLTDIIAQRLPDIANTAQMQLAACRTAIAQLPKPSKEDPSTRLLMLLSEFSTTVRQFVRGSSEPSILVQRNNRAFGIFKRAIRSTAPAFVAIVNPAADRNPYVAVDEDEEQPDEDDTVTPIYLSDVRKVLNRARARELPGDVPPAAKAALIADFQDSWNSAKDECFESVRGHLLEALLSVVERPEFFGRFAAFKVDLKFELGQLLEMHADECMKYLEALLEMETEPMTQNDHYLQATTEKWVARYRDQRAGKRPPKAEAGPDAKRAKLRHDIDAATAKLKATANAFTPNFSPASVLNGPDEKPKLPFSGAFPPMQTQSPFGVFGKPSPAPSGPSLSVFGTPKGAGPPPATATATAARASPPPFSFGRPVPSGSAPAPAQAQSPAAVTATVTATANPAPLAFSPMPHPFSDIQVSAPSPPLTSIGAGFGGGSAPADREELQTALAALAKLGYTGLTEADLGKLRPADEYEAEIVLMGGVRAYFQVSYKRVIDNIPGIIDTKFVKSFASGLQANLIRRFLDLEKDETKAQCARYLMEDQAVVVRRTELAQRLKMLEGVQRELHKFGRAI